MSFQDGFFRGWGLMDQQYQKEENKRRYDQEFGLRQDQSRRQQEEDDYNRQRQSKADAQSAESHALQMTQGGLNNQLRQKQIGNFDEDMELKRDASRAQIGANKAREKQYSAVTANSEKESKRQDLERKFGFYAATQDWASAVQDPDFKDTDFALITNKLGADTAIKITEKFNQGDFKSAIPDLNTLLKPKLNRMVGKEKGRDGGVIKDISIYDIQPIDNGRLKVKVNVTTDKGVYPSTISELRSSRSDDAEKIFDVDDVLGTVGSLGQLATIMKSSGVYDRVSAAANRYVSGGRKQQQMPAEAQTISLLSQMSGIPVDELVRAKYMVQKDQSDSTMRKVALELAQKDTRWEEAGYQENPAQSSKMKNQIIKEYMGYVGGSQQQNGLQAGASQGQYTGILSQAKQAIQSGKDKNAVIQRLIEMGVPQDQINL